MSHVDSAAKALLVAGGQATTEESNNVSPSTNPREASPATAGATGAAGATAAATAAAGGAAGASAGASQAVASSQAAADVVPQGAELPAGAAMLGVGQTLDATPEVASAFASAGSVVERYSFAAHQSPMLSQPVRPEALRQTALPSADSDGDGFLKDGNSNRSTGSGGSSAKMSRNKRQEQQQGQGEAKLAGRVEPPATAAAAPLPAPPQELISADRLVEMIEIECATGEGNFRELIRFLGRTMSNPACIGASFALPQPQDNVGRNARGGDESSSGGNDSSGVSSSASLRASRGQKISVSDFPHNAEEASVAAEEMGMAVESSGAPDDRYGGESGGAERDFTGISGRRAGGADLDGRERRLPSTEDMAIATPPLPVGRADHAPVGVSAGAVEEFVAAATPAGTTRSDRNAADGRKEGEENISAKKKKKWVDRSAVAMDVQAATDVWQVLRDLDVEGVTRTVLNALENLTQTLLTDKILDGERGGAYGWGDHGALLSESDGEGNRGYSDRAGLRSVVLVLEHPEIQDPDFESVLNNLFKLSMRLSEASLRELCDFFAGLEVDRFSRYVMRLAKGRKCRV